MGRKVVIHLLDCLAYGKGGGNTLFFWPRKLGLKAYHGTIDHHSNASLSCTKYAILLNFCLVPHRIRMSWSRK